MEILRANYSEECSDEEEGDPAISNIEFGDATINDIQLIENPITPDIDPNMPEALHSYEYREITQIMREEQHTLTDFLYKLFLISINYAQKQKSKSLPVFKALMNRVRVNSCEVLRAASMVSYKLRALMSYIELTEMAESEVERQAHLGDLKKSVGYQDTFDFTVPEYEEPRLEGRSDIQLTEWADKSLRYLNVHKPASHGQVPRFIYKVLAILYTCYNKQSGTKIATGIEP